MTQPIDQTTNEFLARLRRADIHPDTIKQATERVKLLIGSFECQPEHRTKGSRAVRKGPRKRVRTTLNHLIRAAKDATPGTRGPIGQKSRELLRAIRTFPDFEAMEERARGFAGFRWKETRRQNQDRTRERAPRLEIGTSFTLRQLVTADDLRSVSLTLRLCAHDSDYGYLEALRKRTQLFWVIERDDNPIALLAIDRDEGEVSEADGFDHGPIGLSQSVMLEVLRQLGASADDCKAFSSVGAYSLFLNDSIPASTTIQFDDSVYRVWGREGEVVISRDEDRWSQFRWDADEGGWDAGGDNDIGSGRLADLLSCCRSLAEAFRGYRLSQTSEVCPEDRRPVRRRHPRLLGPRYRRRRRRG